MKRLIGLTGLAQSGKSTVAHYLKSTGFHEDSFAAPIRRCIADILCITLEELEVNKETLFPGFGATPRRMMQTLGTEWGRNIIQNNLWLRALERRIKYSTTQQPTVLSDIRFENEADFIRDLGGEIWHIHRPSIVRSDHISEAGIQRKTGDALLMNENDVADLINQVACLLETGDH